MQDAEDKQTKDDADSRTQIPETPPGIPQTARIKNRTKTWRTDEVQFDDLTIPQRNRIQTAIRNMVANKIDIPTEEVWIELQQGSLQVTMDVGAASAGEWPEDRELTTAVRSVMAGSVADRISRRQATANTEPTGHDAWQSYRPGPSGRQEQENMLEESRISHAPLGHRFALVT